MESIQEKIVGYIDGAKQIARDTGCGITIKFNHTTKKEFEIHDVRTIMEIAKMIERMDKNVTK
jgi:hypothetical protein